MFTVVCCSKWLATNGSVTIRTRALSLPPLYPLCWYAILCHVILLLIVVMMGEAVLWSQNAALMEEAAIDPNEPVFCFCKRVSFGDMVACENEECPIEWFHFGCVGLKEQVRQFE